MKILRTYCLPVFIVAAVGGAFGAFGVLYFEPQPPKAEGGKRTESSKQECASPAQDSQWVFNGVIAVATALQAWFLFGSNRQIAKAWRTQNRPYLLVDGDVGVTLTGNDHRERNGLWEVGVRIDNQGTVPAMLRGIRCGIAVVSEEDSPIDLGHPLARGVVVERGKPYTHRLSARLELDEWRMAAEGAAFLRLRVVATYDALVTDPELEGFETEAIFDWHDGSFRQLTGLSRRT